MVCQCGSCVTFVRCNSYHCTATRTQMFHRTYVLLGRHLRAHRELMRIPQPAKPACATHQRVTLLCTSGTNTALQYIRTVPCLPLSQFGHFAPACRRRGDTTEWIRRDPCISSVHEDGLAHFNGQARIGKFSKYRAASPHAPPQRSVIPRRHESSILKSY
jgi:hypothetical protein